MADHLAQRGSILSTENALPTLKDEPDLIKAIRLDIGRMGVVGETENTLLIYLAGTSRLLRHPLRMIIRGKSSAGKSYPLMRVVSLFPPEEVVEATSLTPQALYYGRSGWLRHKFLVKGERSQRSDEEAADITAALRQLISEDRIVKQVTMRGEGEAGFETVTIIQEGPIAFCETTTAKSIFAEDLNRCLQVWADESHEQTRRIMKAAAEEYLLEFEAVDPELVRARHREFQSSLERVEVKIPYAANLADAISAEKLEARRAFKHVLAAVEAVTLLHQHHRSRDEHGRLIATPDDYTTARRLVMPSMNESLGHGERVWKAYAMRETFPKQFTSSDVMTAGAFGDKMTRDRALKDLVNLGILRCVNEGKGRRAAVWEWTGRELQPALPEAVEAGE